MRWPSFFSLNSVKRTRSAGGRYSLIEVAITVRTFVRAWMALIRW